MAKTNVIAAMHFTDDDVSVYDGPGMLIRKTAKPCINSTWIALFKVKDQKQLNHNQNESISKTKLFDVYFIQIGL